MARNQILTPRARPVPVAIICSVAMHLMIVASGAHLVRSRLNQDALEAQAAASLSPSISLETAISIETPEFQGHLGNDSSPAQENVPAVAEAGGGIKVPRPDSGKRGRGGTNEASQAAVNLADRDDGIRLSRDIASHLDRDQVQRIDSSKTRQSMQDWRATTNPMELTFIASGTGNRSERRTPAEADPALGVRSSSKPAIRGSLRVGAEPVLIGYGRPPSESGGSKIGSSRESPGTGVIGSSAGLDHRSSANVAHARPMVAEGSPSIPSSTRGSPKDNKDSSQEVASTVQSLIHASTAGGQAGEGPGGQSGPGPTGSGGQDGPGSKSTAAGQGSGAGMASNGMDPAISMYRRRVLAKLFPLWEDAFPRWAAIELRQGMVIISMVILSDGSVQNVQVRRPSGIPEFDANCLAAVRRASPFEPLPSNLHLTAMRWDLSFDALNPIR